VDEEDIVVVINPKVDIKKITLYLVTNLRRR